MHAWKFWDWVAYGALFVAAIILALDTGLRLAPDLSDGLMFIHSPLWGFTPLVLMLLASFILLARVMGWIGKAGLPVAETRKQTPPPPEPQVKPRVFVGESVTVEYLINIFREHTGIQGKKLTDTYLGKWMKVTGPLGDVISATSGIAQLTFARVPLYERKTMTDYFFLFMMFRPPWIDRLAILKRGDELTVIGEIGRIDATTVQLENCELVDADYRVPV